MKEFFKFFDDWDGQTKFVFCLFFLGTLALVVGGVTESIGKAMVGSRDAEAVRREAVAAGVAEYVTVDGRPSFRWKPPCPEKEAR